MRGLRLVVVAAAVLAAACPPTAATRCNTDGDCTRAQSCVEGLCASPAAVDAGTRDAGTVVDAGVTDAGTVDAGARDAGPVDGGVVDAGAADAGVDGGAADAGVDAGPTDAGVVDAGSDAGVDAGSDPFTLDDGGVLPAIPFELWGLNEPNDSNGTEHCMQEKIVGSVNNPPGHWNDADCSGTIPYACDPPAGGGLIPGCVIDAASGRELCNDAVTWDVAKSQCESVNSRLAVLTDEADSNALETQAAGVFGSVDAFWIGGTDADGTWKWLDGTPIATPFSIWFAPPNGATAANCVRLVLKDTNNGPPGAWNDLDCATSFPFVCDVPTDAPLASSCTAVIVSGKRRAFCGPSTLAPDASAQCAQMSGALVKITDAADDSALESVAVGVFGVAATDVWIGGSDAAVEGTWRWPDGTFFDHF